jgi:hypothetical protein
MYGLRLLLVGAHALEQVIAQRVNSARRRL